MNFGVSGYGSCQELVLLEERVLAYRPDLVVAVLYHNDLDDNARFGLCRLDAAGELDILKAAQLGWTARVVSGLKSALWQRSHLFVFAATRNPRRGKQTRDATHTASTDGTRNARAAGATRLEEQLAAAALTEEARAALDLHVAILERMHAVCAAHGARFVAVVGVAAQQVDLARPLPGSDGTRRGEGDLDLVNERVAAALRDRNIEVIDLLPAFRAAAAEDALFYRVDGHWTVRGHWTAARALAQELLQHQLLPTANP